MAHKAKGKKSAISSYLYLNFWYFVNHGLTLFFISINIALNVVYLGDTVFWHPLNFVLKVNTSLTLLWFPAMTPRIGGLDRTSSVSFWDEIIQLSLISLYKEMQVWWDEADTSWLHWGHRSERNKCFDLLDWTEPVSCLPLGFHYLLRISPTHKPSGV
jgi:hypothetical protein